MGLFIASIKAGECKREEEKEDGGQDERRSSCRLSERLQFVIRPQSSITQIKAGGYTGQINTPTHTHTAQNTQRRERGTNNHTDAHLQTNMMHTHTQAECDSYCTKNFTLPRYVSAISAHTHTEIHSET